MKRVIPSTAILLLLMGGMGACKCGESPDLSRAGLREAQVCSTPGEGGALSACPQLCDAVGQLPAPPPREGLTRDLIATALDVKLGAMRGTATLQVGESKEPGLSLMVGTLNITGVRGRCGDLKYTVKDGRLDIGVPEWATTVVVDYTFTSTEKTDGYRRTGTTYTWPAFCGNLFPCHPSPDDGVKFSLRLGDLPEGQVAVYPKQVAGDVPAYMLGWAVGAYTERPLGATRAGTQVSVWYLPGEEEAALAGTRHLRDAMDFFETRYGPYTFGDKVGSVSANWGPKAKGGMEHHPFWHLASESMGDSLVHHHEAAHGWYGNGVRIQCWEDFVLSEGTTDYLTARAVRATEGEEAEAKLWESRRKTLEALVVRRDTVVLPDATCNAIDMSTHPLASGLPYLKGSLFFHELEKQVGTAALDSVLARFYQLHVGKAARMQQLLDFVKSETGHDPGPLAQGWLRGLGVPATSPITSGPKP
ncbi:peptidase M1 [Myxococcus sp. CA056]|uniref:M1 family aminopeptidase n=1 Tax=Myxococcus sp. CA056 TaxID=2741740 RepID=UPI00157A9C26|nr:M1 family aminopeptidase [Myxococcus sp. CA056]NTX17085.1 peptidase M1 [Myxococcus sp. CA056]